MSEISLDDIPTTLEANQAGATRSSLVARIKRSSVTRRGVLRAAGVAGALAALNAVSWLSPSARRALAADTEHGWDDCKEIGNYTPVSGTQCFGTSGGNISQIFCRCGLHTYGKWHRSGSSSWYYNGIPRESWWKMTTCAGKNAWIWSGYRCSDGNTKYYTSSPYTAFTICQVSMSSSC